MKKKLGLVLALLALTSIPGSLTAKSSIFAQLDLLPTASLSANCAQVCRECILNGETCGICGPNCCGCN
jgi:hypothetical protein